MNHYKQQLAKQTKRRKELLIEHLSGEPVVLSKYNGIWYCHCRRDHNINTDISDGHCLHYTRLADIDPYRIATVICDHFDTQF